MIENSAISRARTIAWRFRRVLKPISPANGSAITAYTGAKLPVDGGFARAVVVAVVEMVSPTVPGVSDAEEVAGVNEPNEQVDLAGRPEQEKVAVPVDDATSNVKFAASPAFTAAEPFSAAIISMAFTCTLAVP
jgi:hypothetical protein